MMGLGQDRLLFLQLSYPQSLPLTRTCPVRKPTHAASSKCTFKTRPVVLRLFLRRLFRPSAQRSDATPSLFTLRLFASKTCGHHIQLLVRAVENHGCLCQRVLALLICAVRLILF